MSRFTCVSLLALTCLTWSCDRGPKAEPVPSVTVSADPRDITTPGSTASTLPPPPVTPVAPPDPEALAALAKSSNGFGLDLYARVRTTKGNLVVSPASITTALAMTWGGAKGATAAQMKKVLHFSGTPEQVMQSSGKLAASLQDPTRPIKFRVANRLFGEKSYKFEQAYLEATKLAYGAPLESLDFKTASEPARAQINGWVETYTEKRITDLIPPGGVDDRTRLVLVNAIYFLGDWAQPFSKSATQPAPFSVSKTEKKDVATMQATTTWRYGEPRGLKAIELPYLGNSMSMLVVVPNEVDGVDALEQSLDSEKLDAILRTLEPKLVQLALPKFEVNPQKSLALGRLLTEMGMTDAFDAEKADFTGIANPPSPADRLFIAHVFHKAFVRVDEKGTEAAAATAVSMAKGGGMPPQPVVMTVDRPFLFFIRDEASGLVLFMGRVTDPTTK